MIDEPKILDLIKRQKESGLSITAFCSNEGIPKSSFYYWRKKLSKKQGKRFIPLLVNNTPVPMIGPSKTCHREQNDQTTPDDGFLLEIFYTNGTRLRLKGDLDLDHLRSLICLLE